LKIMEKNQRVQIGLLRESEIEEADRIVRLAYSTFMGLPNPTDYMRGREFVSPRWRSPHIKIVAARDGGRLIGMIVVTRWGSFGLLGPLAILPNYWNRGVAHRLFAAAVKVLDRCGVRHSGLFTFANSPMHICLYQKYGYWPGYLTAIMKRAPASPLRTPAHGAKAPVLLSALAPRAREQAIASCAKLANRIERGLDLSDEILALLAQRAGEVLLVADRNSLGAFAVCKHGPGTEGGEELCYVKFAAASNGEQFERLLDSIDALAFGESAEVEVGVSTACENAFQRMRARGYRPEKLGVAMQRPHGEGFNKPGAFVLGDWR
jgi:GNAT superfamily N-acetyltransferase